MKPAPDLSRLKEVLDYNPETGEFQWKMDMSNVIHKGDKVAIPLACSQGYARIQLDKVRYFAHRLAWYYMTEKWPENYIDHINGDRGDNRFANLREANNQQNCWNQSLPQGKNKYIGTSYVAHIRKWQAYITVHGKRHNLGYYATPEEASVVYQEAKTRLHNINLTSAEKRK